MVRFDARGRIARQRVVILTHLPDAAPFWLTDTYVPEITAMDRGIFPSIAEIESVLGPVRVTPVPVPHDCTDGFLGAYWRRPKAYLDPDVRAAISGFAKLPETAERMERLRADLASGEWERANGSLRECEAMDLGYRLVIASHLDDHRAFPGNSTGLHAPSTSARS